MDDADRELMMKCLDEDAFGIPTLDNWYDTAIAQGMGFKSDAEREAYVASLGDPLSHPMFATTTEQLESHPLTEAFRLLREEDKTPTELCIMYKDEGNEWMKKGNRKSWKEALIRYLHALTFIEGKRDEAIEPGSETAILLSQVHSNIALAHLNLKNYGLCCKSAEKAIAYWDVNFKAHFRLCKSLSSLHKTTSAITACTKALDLAEQKNAKPFPTDIAALLQQNQEVQAKRAKGKKQRQQEYEHQRRAWQACWDICTQFGASLSYFDVAVPPPSQLNGQTMPWLDQSGDNEEPCWPCVLSYPEYKQFDAICGCKSSDYLVEHLSLVFPDFTLDPDCRPVSWDQRQDYRYDNLVVYLLVHKNMDKCVVPSRDAWLQYCEDAWVIRHGGAGWPEMQQNENGLSSLNAPPLDNDDDDLVEARLVDAKQRVVSALSKVDIGSDGCCYVEVGMGCTISEIVNIPGHALSGGLLHLELFVKDSESHREFVAREERRSGGGKVRVHGISLAEIRKRMV